MVKCSSCGAELDTNTCRMCSNCGAVLCDNCAKENDNLCTNCYCPTRYMN